MEDNYGRSCPECGVKYTFKREGQKICYSCNWDVIRHLKEILKRMDAVKKASK